MPGKGVGGGSGEIPEKPTTYLEKTKGTKPNESYFNPYRLGKDSTDENNIQSQNSDANTSKADASDPKRWTKQLVDLFDKVGNLTSADTQKLKESIEAGDRINEANLQASNQRQANETQRRQFDGQCRLFEDHKRYMQMNNITEVY